jgi:hypothetical protein
MVSREYKSKVVTQAKISTLILETGGWSWDRKKHPVKFMSGNVKDVWELEKSGGAV